jgi:polyisoprenoid-binding protein YceI
MALSPTDIDPQALLRVPSWDVDSLHSQFFVSVRHMGFVPLRAKFARFTGSLRIDQDDVLRSSFEIEVDTRSVVTGHAPQEDFIRGEGWLDAENHPTLTFRGTAIEPRGGNRYLLRGELTLRGVTAPLDIPIEFHGVHADGWGLRAGFSSRFTVDRRDYGITWNRLFDWGAMAGDDVEIALDIELSHADASLAQPARSS